VGVQELRLSAVVQTGGASQPGATLLHARAGRWRGRGGDAQVYHAASHVVPLLQARLGVGIACLARHVGLVDLGAAHGNVF